MKKDPVRCFVGDANFIFVKMVYASMIARALLRPGKIWNLCASSGRSWFGISDVYVG